MPTSNELIRAIVAPVLVAAIIAAIGRWRRWAWAMPLAAGVGFLTGYALLGIPKLPPQDGNDWLFWLAIPLTLLAVCDALIGRRWTWIFGAAAGGVTYVILRPLVPGGVSLSQAWEISFILAAAGALLVLAVSIADRFIGAAAIAGLCIVIGGAAVVVMSSNLRVVGIDGIAASAALGPVFVFVGTLKAARSVAIVAVPILTGLLVSGHYYPEPGVTWVNFVLLLACPLLLLAGVLVPARHRWMRRAVAILAVLIAVAAITGPTALAAKKAADGDTVDYYK